MCNYKMGFGHLVWWCDIEAKGWKYLKSA